ncbi:hypothetical protein ACIBKZ_15745 [Streptomyces sp. NPDC050421]|uniref:hypothetical protein n=1 Tax=Streptomyces sp. NPDC050421 TaxID=3365613 RepID=UPI003793DC1B
MDTKVCTGCGEDKPVGEYYLRGKTGAPVQPCKECQKARAKAKRESEGTKPMTDEQRELHREKMRRLREQAVNESPEEYRARRAAYQREWRKTASPESRRKQAEASARHRAKG